ncbi:MAG: hypothetical protein Q9173_003846 [Seirophora scorigena]
MVVRPALLLDTPNFPLTSGSITKDPRPDPISFIGSAGPLGTTNICKAAIPGSSPSTVQIKVQGCQTTPLQGARSKLSQDLEDIVWTFIE